MTTHTATPAGYATIEEKWASRVVPDGNGHLLWTRANYLRWGNTLHKPARIAFTIRTGRQPVGYVLPECGVSGCVEQTHVEDEPGRQRIRAALRAVNGLTSRPPICGHNHDQTIHGRYTTDGRAYCALCLTDTRTRPTPGTHTPGATQ